jgi:exopolyphosphatase / guanosine-5'-triphosphate,3'-diphosphate pyrophosphatase
LNDAIAAAVDCGTNSTRLLVAGRDGDGLAVLAREQVVTRLGQGVDGNGELADAAVARTVDAIGEFAEIWKRHGATRVRVVATSAVRDARNRRLFADTVRTRVGRPLEVLSGEQEAAFAFAGAVGAVDPPRPALVLDIGGGSTELIVGAETPAASTSRQLGCVRLTERALPGDPPSDAAVSRARDLIDVELDAAESIIAPHRPVSLVAVAGTATTLGALHAGLRTYDPEVVHGSVIGRDALHRLLERMRGLTAEQIAALGPVQAGREDVLLAGTLIFARVLDRFALDKATISEGDLLDGLCRDTLR